MNILFLFNSFRTGGFEQLTLELCRRLSGKGFDFRLCCLKEEGTLAPEAREAGVRIDSGFLRHRYDIGALRRLKRAFEGEPYDILFTEPGRNALLAGAYLRRALHVPRAVSAIHATRKWGKRRMFGRIQLRLLRRLDGVVACAAMQRDFLVREEGVDASNLTIIFNGVDHETFRPARREELPPIPGGPAGGERAVGIVASLTPEKGHEVFVEAASLTAREIPNVRFFIVGEGPERPAIEAAIRAGGMQARIELTGRRRDLPALLPHFDLLALSSHPFRETLPISTMEGMACGLPTVNTDVGSVRDLVVDGETGLLVPPGDPKAMADAFTRILGDRSLAARMGRAGRKRIEERFTLERTTEEYRRFFVGIARGGDDR